ncbi:HNH endonuclease, partial [Phycicoccus sp. BSK3Z-2]
PARWTDAHHLTHWADGGTTDLDNAALLCGRHHTTVHTRRLTGRVGPHGLEWNLTHGSYDHLLAERAAREPA